MNADLSGARRIRPDLGPRLFRRRSSWSCSPTRCGRRASSSSTKPPACRCARTDHGQPSKTEVDTVTGTATTGHEWDGIRELNTPLPRWWLWLFYVTIVWAIGYWIVYPAWPLLSSYTTGVFGWNSRTAIVNDLNELKAHARADDRRSSPRPRSPTSRPIRRSPTSPMRKAAPSFRENCGPCHGAGGGGAKGYPNLNDNDWLWGGTLDEIQQTIEFGVRSGHAKARESQMPAFGRDGMLEARRDRRGRELCALARRTCRRVPGADLAQARRSMPTIARSVMAPTARATRSSARPNLTDGIWLFGSDEAAIIEVITNSRGGVMPAWAGRLDPMTIKALTFYVHSLGGGEK